MLDAKPKEISEIQRLNYEQVIDISFVIFRCAIFNLWLYSLVSVSVFLFFVFYNPLKM